MAHDDRSKITGELIHNLVDRDFGILELPHIFGGRRTARHISAAWLRSVRPMSCPVRCF